MGRCGPYDLIGLIGRGGMGEVYRARHVEQRREVAVKLLAASDEANPEFAARFRRESYLAASLTNPHVIPIHAYGEIDGRLYLEMPLIEGDDLAGVLRGGRLPVERTFALLAQAADALDAAHGQGLVHRDVKPSNLLVTGRDFVYLVDFGLAQTVGTGAARTALTASGQAIGTLAYMAPERFGSEPSGSAADVYALACVLHESLTGQPPFTEDSLPGLLHAHLYMPPPRASAMRSELAPALDDVLARGMAKNPEDRPRSATALIEAARAAAAPTRAATRVGAPSGLLDPLPAPSRSHPRQTRIAPEAPHRWDMAPPRTPAPEPRAVASPPYPLHPAPPPYPYPPTAPRTSGSGWVAAAGVLVAVSIVLAALVLAGLLPGGAEAEPDGAPQAQPSAPSTVTVPASPNARSTGDLGLTETISQPACSGDYIVVVRSAVDPSTYRQEIASALSENTGASYLLTQDSCGSLDSRSDDGAAIYAAYLGPFSSVSEACASRAGVGGDSYLRRLDNTTPVGTSISC